MEFEIITLVIAFSLIGAAVGTFTGLTPGIHVNTLASLLLMMTPVVSSIMTNFCEPQYVPIGLAAAVVSAAVVHSFTDYVPSVFIGAPEADDVGGMLPGHRLMMQGHGMVAIRTAAAGSMVGAVVAVLIAIPMQMMIDQTTIEYLSDITWVVILVALCLMIINEPSMKKWPMCMAVILVSGILGSVCMFLPIPSAGLFMDGGLLFPMLTGLFGLPALITSFQNANVPEQTDEEENVSPSHGIGGAVIGAIAGWFPGITATVGAAFGGFLKKNDDPVTYISLVSSIGTATTVFSLITLSITGSGRSGTMLVVKDILCIGTSGFNDGTLMLLLLSVAIACFVGYIMTLTSGALMSKIIGKVNIKKMNLSIICIMIVLVIILTGFWGLVIMGVGVVIGMIPLNAEISRINLSGCLLIPVMMTSMGIDGIIMGML